MLGVAAMFLYSVWCDNLWPRARKTAKRTRQPTAPAEAVSAEDQAGLETAATQPDAQPQQPAPQQVVNQEQDRAVGIGHDAIGNAIISGDGNIVVVQNITQHVEPEKEQAADDATSDIGPNPYKGWWRSTNPTQTVSLAAKHRHVDFGKCFVVSTKRGIRPTHRREFYRFSVRRDLVSRRSPERA